MRHNSLTLVLLFAGLALGPADSAAQDGLLGLVVTPLQREIERHIDTQKQIIGSLLNVNPDTKLSSLFPSISGFNHSQIIECYNSSIGDVEFSLFENTIFDAVKTYYKYFPENFQLANFGNKVKSLFKSMNEIGSHTVQCLVNPTNYQLGVTQFTDFSDAEYNVLLGAKRSELEDRLIVSNFAERPLKKGRDNSSEESEESKESKESSETSSSTSTSSSNGTSNGSSNNATSLNSTTNGGNSSSNSSGTGILNRITGGLIRNRRQQVVVDPICFPKDKSKLPERFDWRSRGKVTPVRYQGSCGSCWSFASLAALESAYLIKGKTNNKKFDLSEQQLLACARQNGCKGGTSVDAFNFILSNDGVTDEASLPYDYKKDKCDSNKKKKKKRVATIKDYCLRGIYAQVNGKPENLSDEQIQQVIREFGPVYATINADHVAVKHLKSGVYNNKKCSKTTNHAILIVGWDKKAWIIKNSWGSKWADGGYFRMKRGDNMCGLNTYITFPIV